MKIFHERDVTAIMHRMQLHKQMRGRPNVRSLDSDLHIFFYADNLKDAEVLWVNAKKRQWRIICRGAGANITYHVYRTWNGLNFPNDWSFLGAFNDLAAALGRLYDAKGERGPSPGVPLLPKLGDRDSPRQAVYENSVFDLKFAQGLTSFQIRDTHATREWSPALTGKPWMSSEARAWCRAHQHPLVITDIDDDEAVIGEEHKVLAEMMTGLESTELWGLM